MAAESGTRPAAAETGTVTGKRRAVRGIAVAAAAVAFRERVGWHPCENERGKEKGQS